MIFNNTVKTILEFYSIAKPKIAGNNIISPPNQVNTNVGYLANNQNSVVLIPRKIIRKKKHIKK